MKTRQKSRDASGILLVCLMWMLSLSSSLHAQTWNINGNVTDEQGEPIIGANVVIQGTGTGTITDVEGNFKLASVTKGAVMEISFIGYISKTLQVKDASSLKIVLKEDNQALDEVVVVGYGVQRKSDLTGSVASVNSDVLESRPQANLIQSLQGAVPGLNTCGLNGDAINGLLVDKYNHLWIQTKQKLIELDVNSLSFGSYYRFS